MLYTFLVDDNIFESQFSCAVVNVYNGLTKPLLFGSSQGKTEGLSQVVGAIKNAQNTQQVEQVLDEYGVDFEDEEKFNEFLNKCNKLSLYDTNIQPEYKSSLITLSTCEYSNKNGRLVVVAYKLDS